ncbi:hypothetical protein [Actinopolymorpha alba]|uniref:hypothetical protein n=1 Tax=Actinopolymorpha alba TaxID=533267 RepID=UPI00036C52A9|nr:hypothetical protein [Actinopolymorpha alba]
MLLREALRRLATPLAGAHDTGARVAEESTRMRYAALLRVLAVVKGPDSALA